MKKKGGRRIHKVQGINIQKNSCLNKCPQEFRTCEIQGGFLWSDILCILSPSTPQIETTLFWPVYDRDPPLFSMAHLPSQRDCG